MSRSSSLRGTGSNPVVENYETYIRIQTEAAIRHLANQFAYDNDEDGRLTLLTGVRTG
jgi:hypothetical protein